MTVPFDMAAEQLCKLILEAHRRWSAIQGQQEQATRLNALHTSIRTNMHTLQQARETCPDNLDQNVQTILDNVVNEMEKIIVKTELIIKNKLENMDSRVYAFVHTDRNEAQFAELESNARDLEAKILHVCTILATARRSNSDADVFRASIFVNAIEDDIALDYTSKKADRSPVTCEGSLLDVILGKCATVAAVVGMGGVGKTCALMGLASRAEVRQRFPGGIYFMTLGQNAVHDDFIRELSTFVQVSGGFSTAERMIQTRELRVVVSIACSWFKSRECLFLIDDVWPVDLPPETLQTLSMLGAHDGGVSQGHCVVYSARDEKLSEIHRIQQRVHFFPMDCLSSNAEKMFLKAAGLSRTDLDLRGSTATCSILDACGGLPLLLSLQGRLVLAKLKSWRGIPSSILEKHAEELKEHPASIGKALLSSLEFLDKTSRLALSSTGTLSRVNILSSLCVLRKRDWAPLPFLKILWNVDRAEVVEELVGELARFHILEKETVPIEGEHVIGIRLHDLVHDFSVHLAKENQIDWYQRVVMSYETQFLENQGPFKRQPSSDLGQKPDHLQNINSSTIQSKSCWTMMLRDDDYVATNLSRLLLRGRKPELLEKTLCDPRWVVRMMGSKNILQYERDIATLCAASCTMRRESSLDLGIQVIKCSSSAQEKLLVLGKIARMSLDLGNGPAQKRWFQLYARLQATQPPQEWMLKMLEDIRELAPRPFLRPVSPCLKGALDPAIDYFQTEFAVLEVRMMSENLVVAYGTNGGGIIFVKTIRRGSESELSEINSTAGLISGEQQLSCRGLGGLCDLFSKSRQSLNQRVTVSCLSVSSDGTRLATAHSNGFVRAWDISTAQPLCRPIAAHKANVNAVTFSRDGMQLATASSDFRVRVWNVATGKKFGPTMAGHRGEVRAVAMSPDGTFIVSGSDDNTIRLWYTQSGKQFGPALTGHTDWVCSVAFSTDGTRVVSGSDDKTVRLWDVESGSQVGPTLTGHTSVLQSVAISADGSRLASGSEDGIVRLWDADTGKQIGPALTGHAGRVESVAISADGMFILSGSEDQTMRLWDTASNKFDYSTLNSTSTWVHSVAMSADGTRVVSGSDDNIVRLWNTESGKQVGPAFIGHANVLWCTSMNSDRTRVASGSDDNTVRVWNTETGTSDVHESENWAPCNEAFLRESRAFSASGGGHVSGGQLVVSARGGQIIVSTKEQEDTAVAEVEGKILAFAVSADKTRVAAGLSDGTVAILHLES